MKKGLNIQAIRQAQTGDIHSLAAVAEHVRPKVYTYIYRLTLDYHLTQDLTQETVLEMVKTLPKLKVPHVNGFWGWIFRTALGKVQHHFRLQGAQRLARKTTSDDTILEYQASRDNNPMDALVSEEIRKAVLDAMNAIKIKYRNILVLRCFENLSYGQIAGITGGSELKARLLFFRAKHSLKNQLEHHGFKRDHLLAALTIFAGLTVQNGEKVAAGEVVLTSSLESGLGVGLAGLLTAKTAITAVCILIVSGFAVSRITQPNSQPNHIPTSEELYSNLYPLLKRVEFMPPSRVIKVNDPDNDGLLLVNQGSPQKPVQRLQKDQIRIDLVNQPHMGIILPKDHWMELGFDGILHDGPGPDLLIVSRHCRWYIKVLVTDGMGKVLELPQPDCLHMGVCRRIHIIDFDLAQLDIPFEPHTVRVMGKFNNEQVRGIELYSVRARIQRTEP